MNAAPVIIIKRKKVVGDAGHHGGAWKVAYADFVTAMMAFFLLMWLLNATTETQRKGIADYFSPTIPISRISGGGDGEFGGDSVFSEKTLTHDGLGASQRHPTEAHAASGETGLSRDGQNAAERQLTQIQEKLLGRSGESEVANPLLRHILTHVTDEGLVIELFDRPGAQLFAPGTDTPTQLLRDLARLIASVAGTVTNGIALGGDLRAVPVIRKVQPAWSMSVARAQRMRELLQQLGLSADRMRRVTGHGDRRPVTNDPMALRNNRVEVILLRGDGGRG